jgi:hypothetical protein
MLVPVLQLISPVCKTVHPFFLVVSVSRAPKISALYLLSHGARFKTNLTANFRRFEPRGYQAASHGLGDCVRARDGAKIDRRMQLKESAVNHVV